MIHAGPTSRTLAPAARTAASRASLCAASTSATQPPSAPGATSTSPGAPSGGGAPAPTTRIRGATAAAATQCTPPSCTRRRRVAPGRPTWSAHTTSAPRAAALVSRPSSAARGGLVQAGGRLVEDHHVGLARQRRSERDALALAVGERAQGPLQRRVERRGDLLAGDGVAADARQLAHPGVPGQPGDRGEAFGRVAGPQPGRALDAPARRRRDPRHEPQQGRLAGAVGALHGDHGARPQLEIDVTQDRRAPSVALGDLMEGDHGGGSGAPSRRRLASERSAPRQHGGHGLDQDREVQEDRPACSR